MSKRLIVIGAGAAGSFAHDLKARGYEVIVLEARPAHRRAGLEAMIGWASLSTSGRRGSWGGQNPLSAIAGAARIELVPTHWDRLAVYRGGARCRPAS